MPDSVPRLIAGWKQIQEEMRLRLEIRPLPVPRFVGGADIAFTPDNKHALAAALVWDTRDRRVVEIACATRPVEVPYVPGYLSFREGPVLQDAIARLQHPFAVMTFDGQGYAHPRRCGLATYMGIKLAIPSIGVAKSRLIGTHDEPPIAAGGAAALMDKGEQIGTVLRTRDRVRPIYVSVGNRVDLASAVKIMMACVTKYRIPEPTRLADIEVARLKREGKTPR